MGRVGGAVCVFGDRGVEIELSEGEIFTLYRRRRGLTQEAVARRAGVPRPYVSRWEVGKQELAADVCGRLWAAVAEVAA